MFAEGFHAGVWYFYNELGATAWGMGLLVGILTSLLFVFVMFLVALAIYFGAFKGV